MKNKTRWFVKPINDITNEMIHNLLAKTSSHQDGASQEIPVKVKKELLIEVPSYNIIKMLYESTTSIVFLKFEVYIMPPGAKKAGPWTLRTYQKNGKIIKNINPQPLG